MPLAKLDDLASGDLDDAKALVVDVLLYCHRQDGFPGIDDLSPRSARYDSFLKRLEGLEGLGPKDKILAVGGVAQPAGPMARFFVNRLLGGSDHDLVVRRSSSLPGYLSPQQRIKGDCDHFSYLVEAQSDIHGRVAEAIKEALKDVSTGQAGAQSDVSASQG